MITSNYLFADRPHQIGEGVQRFYRFRDGNGLSVVNSKILHSYEFAWEIAVVSGLRKNMFGQILFDGLRYDTPLTSDIEVCSSDEEANTFIERAAAYFGCEE